MKNEISVVMPTYNAEKYLKESIESILNQTFKDFEFIIINDGSTDNSLKIIKGYERKDKRIILINNPKNLGLQKTLNKGLEVAKGKYIVRMDADDISMPNRFKIQFEYLEEHKDIFLVGSSAIVIDEFGNRLGIFEKQNNPSRVKKKLEKSNSVIHPSIMFRNEGFFYREKFKTSEDYDLYLRILSSGRKITHLPDFLIKYRISRNSFMSTKPDQQFFYEKAKEFYRQRIEEGKDDYDELDRQEILPQEDMDFERNYLKLKVLLKFQDNQMKEVRRNIKLCSQRYGFERNLLIIYLASFVPYRITKFIKNMF